MRYLLLIYTPEAHEPTFNTEEWNAQMTGYQEFTEGIVKEGIMLGGEPLQPIATATTVRVRDGKMTTIDGPFAETREQLGGFYMIEGRDLDHAIEVAAKIPGAKLGSIEIRPIMELG